jgi:hypothetical protein
VWRFGKKWGRFGEKWGRFGNKWGHFGRIIPYLLNVHVNVCKSNPYDD